MIRPLPPAPSGSPPPPQLVYSLAVDPDPITVSTIPADPQYATLILTITNDSGKTFTFGSIEVALPIGRDAGSLTDDWTGIQDDLANNPDGNAFQVTTPPSNTSDTAIWTIGPYFANQLPAGASLVLYLAMIPVSSQVGTAFITVTENDAEPLTFPVTKMDSGFYFDSLIVTFEGQPVAQVPHGSQVDLQWNSSIVDLSYYTVYSSGIGVAHASPAVGTPAGSFGSFRSGNLTADTIFTVVLEIPSHLSGVPPARYALSTAVAVVPSDVVANDVTAQSLTIPSTGTLSVGVEPAVDPSATCAQLGNTQVKGTLTVGLPGFDAGGQLVVLGTTEMSISEDYPATVLTVDGPGVATGTPASPAPPVVVINDPNPGHTALEVNGGLSLLGAATMLQSPVSVLSLSSPNQTSASATFIADTDGFLVGYVSIESSDDVGPWGVVTVQCTYPNGTVVTWRASTPQPYIYWGTDYAMMTLPIPNGTAVAVSFESDPAGADCYAYFYPLGVGTATLQTA